MPMEELPVGVAVRSPKASRDDVVDLRQVPIAEKQSTAGASPTLPSEEPGDPPW
jgi:hypothetical protein